MSDADLQVSGRTVEEATRKAEDQLGLDRDEFETEIVREGKNGLLGVGAEDAIIKVRIIPVVESSKGEVGDVGVEVLSRLIELMGLDGDVSFKEESDTAVLNIEGDDLGVLIGRRGTTLSSLQHIVRLIIASRVTEWPMLTVDVCGYKQRRRAALESLAERLAEQVKVRHRPITLEPMPADERRVVHLTLADRHDVYTESVGEDAGRKVIIYPKRP
ncbi:MAG: protein jag [Dehalococcoidia bacterium]|nr:protein jag [Dehalococcoidia bacterium]